MSQQDVTLLPHVIVTGNIGEGFELYGPFPNFIAAANHADRDGDLPDHDWWLMPVYPVDNLKDGENTFANKPAELCSKCSNLLGADSIAGGRCTCCGTMVLPVEEDHA